jgi:hypothetical protein
MKEILPVCVSVAKKYEVTSFMHQLGIFSTFSSKFLDGCQNKEMSSLRTNTFSGSRDYSSSKSPFQPTFRTHIPKTMTKSKKMKDDVPEDIIQVRNISGL